VAEPATAANGAALHSEHCALKTEFFIWQCIVIVEKRMEENQVADLSKKSPQSSSERLGNSGEKAA
jgi:hypothetical protein